MIYLSSRPEAPKPQYKRCQNDKEVKPLVLTYFAIQALGEVIKLILAETQTPYDCVSMIGGEEQSDAMEWRSLSPNGLLAMISGWGVPRSEPLSQSRVIIEFLAKKLGMDGGSDILENRKVEILFETAKDLGDKRDEISASNATKDDTVAKGAYALGKRIEKMLEKMPSPKDETSVLNYGQLQLFHVLHLCEARRKGCVEENLGKTLAAFHDEMVSRNGLKQYLQSTARFPWTCGDMGKDGGYQYAAGPLRRGDIKY